MLSESLSLLDAWVKAAIEHCTLKIIYNSGPIKNEITEREVEPDYIFIGDNWEDFGCWGFCRLRNQIRVFNVQGILSWEITENQFKPNPKGRWRDLLGYYKRNDLELF
ncbi:WYL domain-containing protein [Candidatus Bathyarchaeota archaeon]|nr:MAG: WYL domain-containing protein [Candidatus Bathyarchaeota archaeon]